MKERVTIVKQSEKKTFGESFCGDQWRRPFLSCSAEN